METNIAPLDFLCISVKDCIYTGLFLSPQPCCIYLFPNRSPGCCTSERLTVGQCSLHGVLQCYTGCSTPSASHLSVGAFVTVCRVTAGIVFPTVLHILLLPCLPIFRILEFFYYVLSPWIVIQKKVQ